MRCDNVDVYRFTCPTCNARVGDWCYGRAQRNPHVGRLAKAPVPKYRTASADAIPAAQPSCARISPNTVSATGPVLAGTSRSPGDR